MYSQVLITKHHEKLPVNGRSYDGARFRVRYQR